MAYPDRIARDRGGGGGAFLLASGRGGNVDPASSLAREPFTTFAELTGAAASGRIVLAAPITLAEIETRLAGKIEDRDTPVTFDAASASCGRGAIAALARWCWPDQIKQVTPDGDTAKVLTQGIASQGLEKLPWSKAALQFRTRVEFLRKAEGDEWPDLSDDGLAKSAAQWLEPLLTHKTARSGVDAGGCIGRRHVAGAGEFAAATR